MVASVDHRPSHNPDSLVPWTQLRKLAHYKINTSAYHPLSNWIAHKRTYASVFCTKCYSSYIPDKDSTHLSLVGARTMLRPHRFSFHAFGCFSYIVPLAFLEYISHVFTYIPPLVCPFRLNLPCLRVAACMMLSWLRIKQATGNDLGVHLDAGMARAIFSLYEHSANVPVLFMLYSPDPQFDSLILSLALMSEGFPVPVIISGSTNTADISSNSIMIRFLLRMFTMSGVFQPSNLENPSIHSPSIIPYVKWAESIDQLILRLDNRTLENAFLVPCSLLHTSPAHAGASCINIHPPTSVRDLMLSASRHTGAELCSSRNFTLQHLCHCVLEQSSVPCTHLLYTLLLYHPGPVSAGRPPAQISANFLALHKWLCANHTSGCLYNGSPNDVFAYACRCVTRDISAKVAAAPMSDLSDDVRLQKCLPLSASERVAIYNHAHILIHKLTPPAILCTAVYALSRHRKQFKTDRIMVMANTLAALIGLSPSLDSAHLWSRDCIFPAYTAPCDRKHDYNWQPWLDMLAQNNWITQSQPSGGEAMFGDHGGHTEGEEQRAWAGRVFSRMQSEHASTGMITSANTGVMHTNSSDIWRLVPIGGAIGGYGEISQSAARDGDLFTVFLHLLAPRVDIMYYTVCWIAENLTAKDVASGRCMEVVVAAVCDYVCERQRGGLLAYPELVDADWVRHALHTLADLHMITIEGAADACDLVLTPSADMSPDNVQTLVQCIHLYKL